MTDNMLQSTFSQAFFKENFVFLSKHDDIIKWKHFPRYWPFVWRIHRSPVNSPHQGWGQFNSGIGIAGQFQFQFHNWKWNWKWNWNWKPWNWSWNWKPWNWSWNWKPELNFPQLLPQHLLVNQQFPNFSFNHVNRGGHDLSRDWLLMQQLCSWDIAPCGVVTKDTWGGYLVHLE